MLNKFLDWSPVASYILKTIGSDKGKDIESFFFSDTPKLAYQVLVIN